MEGWRRRNGGSDEGKKRAGDKWEGGGSYSVMRDREREVVMEGRKMVVTEGWRQDLGVVSNKEKVGGRKRIEEGSVVVMEGGWLVVMEGGRLVVMEGGRLVVMEGDGNRKEVI